MPVIHQGYLDVLANYRDKTKTVYLITAKQAGQLIGWRSDPVNLRSPEVMTILKQLGFGKIQVLKKNHLRTLGQQPLLVVNDQLSRAIVKKFFQDCEITWLNVFLRWDRDSVLSTTKTDFPRSNDPQDIKFITAAYQQSKKSSDWWRQVGVVVVKEGKVILKAYNQGVPNDHTPYQQGAVRDYFKAGEKPELANYIHAEQSVISRAAKQGVVLQGADLYVTHFPCPVCAKAVAYAGLSRVFFAEGSASLDGKNVLLSRGIKIFQVEVSKE